MTQAPLLVVMGGSAGSLQVLATILEQLPPGLGTPIAIVIHVPVRGRHQLQKVLANRCQLPILEVDDKQPLCSGTVYICPADYHLLIEAELHFSLSVDEPVNFSRPAIDVLFESAALACGPRLLGVLLSGANRDGAEGLAAIKAAGGFVIVQAPETAEVRTMPEAALARCAADAVLAPIEIGRLLAKL